MPMSRTAGSTDASSSSAAEPQPATILDAWLSHLRKSAAACAADPGNPKYVGAGSAGIYGAAAVLPGGEVSRILERYCDTLYLVRK